MSGSFWKFSNGFTSLSNISTLLENYNRDLESGKVEEEGQLEVLKKLLDENDLLQELLSNNPMLMSFLREDKILGMLVNLVILEGAVDEDNPSIKDSKNKIDTKESTVLSFLESSLELFFSTVFLSLVDSLDRKSVV